MDTTPLRSPRPFALRPFALRPFAPRPFAPGPLASRLLAASMLIASLLALALPERAIASPRALVRVAVVDRDSGRELPQYAARGERWVAGTPGHRYAVRLDNASGERVLVVLSVDGVNAVTGETASPDQAGYVLEPWQGTEVEGWRKSLDDVARFVFTDLPDSYAARTGRADNVGVIGIAVFRERRPPPVAVAPQVAPGADSANAAATAKSGRALEAESAQADEAARQRLGTGHGERTWSPVARTGFERTSRRPAQVSQLRYDDRDTLVALGILPAWDAAPPRPRPQAFPQGFVPDPPAGW